MEELFYKSTAVLQKQFGHCRDIISRYYRDFDWKQVYIYYFPLLTLSLLCRNPPPEVTAGCAARALWGDCNLIAIGSHFIPCVKLCSNSVGLHLPDKTMPPGSSSALPPLSNTSSQGEFSLASSNFLHPSLLPNTSVPDFWGSQAPSSRAGCKCSVPCPPGPSKPQKFGPAEAWNRCREGFKWLVTPWSGKLKPGSQELYEAHLRSDYFAPEGEYGLLPRAPMHWPYSGL